MSDVPSEVSSMHTLFNEISQFLTFKDVLSKQTLTCDESSLPATLDSCCHASDVALDNTYSLSNLTMDVDLCNTAEITEIMSETQDKNTSLGDFKCHEIRNDEAVPLSSEIQNRNGTIKHCPEKIKCMAVNCNADIQGLENINILKENTMNGLRDVHYGAENYKLTPNIPQTEERCCRIDKTAVERMDFGESVFNAAQPVLHPSSTTNISSDPGIVEIKFKESKSYFCQNIESLQNVMEHKSPIKTLVSDAECSAEKGLNSHAYDDEKLKKTATVPVRLLCANDNIILNLVNRPMVYSGEIAKVPCISINQAVSNFHLKSSEQPKQAYIPKRFLYQCNSQPKSKSIRKILPDTNASILMPVSSITHIDTDIPALSISNHKSQTGKYVPNILGGKTQKQNNVDKRATLKPFLPSTMKMIAKHVSASGFSPVTSKGIYSVAKACTQKTQAVGSCGPKIVPQMLPSTNATAQTVSISETPSTKIPVIKDITSLPILPSAPKEVSDAHNIYIEPLLEQSTLASIVKMSAKEVENTAISEDLNVDISCISATETDSSTRRLRCVHKETYSQISLTENLKLNLLQGDNASWTENAKFCNKGVVNMAKDNPSNNAMKVVKAQRKRNLTFGNRTKRKEKRKHEDAIGMTKSIAFVHKRRHRNILPKCESEINLGNKKPNDRDKIIGGPEIGQMNGKASQVSMTCKMSIQQRKTATKNYNSISFGSSQNKSAILNQRILSQSSSGCKVIDTAKPKHVHNECKNEPNKTEEDFSRNSQYSIDTRNPSLISVVSDRSVQVDVVNDDTPSSTKPGYDSGKGSSLTSPLHGNFSKGMNDKKHEVQDVLLYKRAVQQMVPTSPIPNPYVSSGGANMFIKSDNIGSCGTAYNKDKFFQQSVSQNANNRHHASVKWNFTSQEPNKAPQSHYSDVILNSDYNKHNIDYGKDIQSNIWFTSEEENDFHFSDSNFQDVLPEARATEHVGVITLNNRNRLTEHLIERSPTKAGTAVKQSQNTTIQDCNHRTRKSKASSVKLRCDKPYICYYCGKSEHYRVILQRHMSLEHGYTPPAATKI